MNTKKFLEDIFKGLSKKDIDRLKSSLSSILSTDKGKRISNPEFGISLEDYLDIYKKEAAGIFCVQPEQVTPEMRRLAKIICFSKLYGKK
jgi:hypothetical protein